MSKADRERRSERSPLARHVDVATLAALTVAVLLLVAATVYLGGAATAERIGCGLNTYVNALMAYPRPCTAPERKAR